MAVGIVQTMPSEFTTEAYDAVQEKLGLKENPPAGLLVHSLGKGDNGMVIFDIWESEEQFDEFREGKINPALKEVVGDEAYDNFPTPERGFYELHNLVKT
jgi:hypothetical protein